MVRRGQFVLSAKARTFWKSEKNRRKGNWASSKDVDMLSFKCWYYDTAIADGNEDRINEMLPNNLPDDIQKLYDHAHSDDED